MTGLTKRHGSIVALDGCSLQVPAGHLVGRLGPNGAVFTLAAIYGLFRVGARLYRNAILHSGARLHLREAWRSEQVPQQS